jgi:MinD superfamily P-loop ATPase
MQVKQIAVVSGKGGTGKTSVLASFATLAGRSVIADCDVDAATLHLLLDPKIISRQEFKGSKLASIDPDRCANCGLCENACRYGAISELKVDPILCEGCGVCAHICPEGAISLEERLSGYAYISETRLGPMSHAQLQAAETNSGKLVSIVRYNARKLVEKTNLELILIDGPPGIGCPVIASMTGTDIALIVTEPTLSGLYDLERILDLGGHLGVTPLVIVNMYDINRENTQTILEYCQRQKIEIVGMIPFDPTVTEAMVACRSVIEHSPDCDASKAMETAWKAVLQRI